MNTSVRKLFLHVYKEKLTESPEEKRTKATADKVYQDI